MIEPSDLWFVFSSTTHDSGLRASNTSFMKFPGWMEGNW